MSGDLISRQAVLAVLRDYEYGDLIAGDVEKLPAIIPQVVCNITGGLLQGASATHKVDVYLLDYDLGDCTNEEKIIDPDGAAARFGQGTAAVHPEFVRKVRDAPLMSEMAECANCYWSGSIDDLNEIQHLEQRVGAGEVMPAGECPECGCLAHLTYPEDDDA